MVGTEGWQAGRASWRGRGNSYFLRAYLMMPEKKNVLLNIHNIEGRFPSFAKKVLLPFLRWRNLGGT